MRRADRLLQIVQILRRANGRPVSAQTIAEELEVTQRTIYRDMVAMESINVPVRGEAGVGYVLEEGYDLPPLIFNSSELEALMLGARFVEANGDADQLMAAKDVVAKISAVLPEPLRREFLDIPLYAPPGTKSPQPDKVSTQELRRALRAERIIRIEYRDANGTASTREVWPIALGFFDTSRVLAAWCVLRQDFRAFRADRIVALEMTDSRVPRNQKTLLKEWLVADKARNRSY